MAITIPSYDEIRGQFLAFLRNRFPGKDTHDASFLGKIANAVARQISVFLVSVQNADNDSLPSLKTSYQALVNMAISFGLPADTLGNFGPRGATAATGGIAPLTGTNGTVFADGLLLTAPDGVTALKLSGAQTIPGLPPGTGSINGNIIASTAGKVGNLAAGSVLTWQTPPSGADSSVTLSTGTSGALDTESFQALLARILARLQTPPKGGASPDYRSWAESVSGVYRAYVYPRKRGTGTVDIVVTAAGSGVGRVPSSAVQTATSNYINGNASTNPPVQGTRPVTSSGTTVDLPYTAASGLAIRIRVTTSQNKYAFDWALGATVLTVASYAANVLTTNEALPTALTQAIDAYKASPGTVNPPRLQVMSTALSAPGIALPVNAVDYNSGAKTITIQAPPAGWAVPVATNPIYPYGNAVPLVAQGASPAVQIGGVQGYIDSLGPSRKSGYANALDLWNDTASIFSLGQVAIDAVDADGATKPVSRVIAVTINGVATDVQASDTIANGIELLYVGSIAVTD